jgi:hypothetical protein
VEGQDFRGWLRADWFFLPGALCALDADSYGFALRGLDQFSIGVLRFHVNAGKNPIEPVREPPAGLPRNLHQGRPQGAAHDDGSRQDGRGQAGRPRAELSTVRRYSSWMRMSRKSSQSIDSPKGWRTGTLAGRPRPDSAGSADDTGQPFPLEDGHQDADGRTHPEQGPDRCLERHQQALEDAGQGARERPITTPMKRASLEVRTVANSANTAVRPGRTP